MEAGAFSALMLAGFFGGWEIVLILAVILMLYGAKSLPDLLAGRRPVEDDHEASVENGPASRLDQLFLWIAQGFDIGRIPVAPGTFGTLVGLLWFAILLVPGSPIFFLAGTVFGFAVSIWLCGEAERILGRRDPGSVVLDEIVAMPICFLPWVAIECLRGGDMPAVEIFFTGRGLLLTAVLFALFRIFDIVKPWPIAKSQFLPGGLGVTADDILAAIYVAAISLFFVG